MTSTASNIAVLIKDLTESIIVKAKNLCRSEWLTAAPGAPGVKPPLRSQGHIDASAAYLASSSTFAADVVDMNAANRRQRQDELETIRDRLKFWEKQDRYEQDKFEEDLLNYSQYGTFCTTVESILGVLGPTGTEYNQLFGGYKHSIGPDVTTQLQLHQVLSALQALRAHHSINALEALVMLNEITQPSRSFSKQSGIEFRAYSRKLVDLYETLDATIPDPAPGAVKEDPHFSIKLFCGLLQASVATGAHGIQVNKELTRLVPPTETSASFNSWLSQSYVIVDAEAKLSSEERVVMPKLTAIVAKKEAVTKKTDPPTCEEINKHFKGYRLPTAADAPKMCPYPHFKNPGHHGHECRNAAKIVQQPNFVNKDIHAEVYAELCKVVVEKGRA